MTDQTTASADALKSLLPTVEKIRLDDIDVKRGVNSQKTVDRQNQQNFQNN